MTEQVRYTIPTSTEYWGPDYEPEQALEAARLLRDSLQRYADHEFPGRVSVELVPERQSWNNRAQGDEEIIESLKIHEENLLEKI